MSMKVFLKRAICLALSCSVFISTTAFADALTVKYNGKTEPDSLVGFMVVGADADMGALDRGDIHTTDIIRADASGNFSKTVHLDDAIFDEATGAVSNYKAIANVELTEELLGGVYYFKEFTVSPVEEDGVLYVPIEEALDLIGGETVSYRYIEEIKTYAGKANNGSFTISMGKTVEFTGLISSFPV